MPDGAPARRSFRETLAFKLLISAAVVGLMAAVASRLDFRRDLGFVDLKLLSGSPDGHYFLVAQQVSDYVARQHGRVTNVPSDGSVDNVNRLVTGARTCKGPQLALAQDGVDWPLDAPIQLVGRLPRAETVFLLGRRADAIDDFAHLAHAKVGIGPAGGGTAHVAHQIFDSADFRPLSIQLSEHSFAEQIDLAARGELDLALFVMDEDAPLIRDAVRQRGLQILGLPHAAVVAHQLSHFRTALLSAGEFDPIRTLPPADKGVLQVETLVVTNGCASRSQTIGLMEALTQVYPDFIRYNRETANTTGLRINAAAKAYFDHEGPEVFDEYAPWLVDVMPPGNWVYIVTGVSLLFNVMGFGHRYRLWQIDVKRVKLEQQLFTRFGQGATLGDIERLEPSAEMRSPENVGALRDLIHRLEELAARSRRDSLSILVPMGQEMGYRYQENLIHQTLAVLRGFLRRSTAAS